MNGEQMTPATLPYCTRTASKQVLVTESSSLIDELARRLSRLFGGRPPQTTSKLPTGWHELVIELIGDIDRLLDARSAERFEVLQVMQRFTGLRLF